MDMCSSTGKLLVAQTIMITLWGSAFAGIRVGLKGFSPENIALLRLLVGSFTLLLYAMWSKIPFPKIKDIPMFMLLGFLGFAVYQTALNFGERTVSAGPSSLIVSLTPIFIGLFSFLFLKVNIGKQMWIGSIIAFIGVVFISVGAEGKFSLNSGTYWVLLASISESIYFLLQERYIKKYGFVSVTIYTIWSAAICMLLFSPGLKDELLHASASSLASCIYLGIFPTVIAYLALAYITDHTGASEAAITLYLTPAAAFVVAWLWLGEKPSLITIFGGFITLAGVTISNLKLGRKKEHLEESLPKAVS
jgi:drug/metabolite transporter (DMT)-like permease